ncbi:MAG TPA: M15 family metallopeptidase [Candidatus Saccharimonadales bacterium]|nr:M15 family metallopeptidase [Candidatus Saccharimonadales bacterium]
METELVDIATLIPNAIFDIRSDDATTKLDPVAAENLVKAAKYFNDFALRVVIWNAYFAKPNHTNGLAIDVTLAYKDGELLDMGTDFADSSPKAQADAEGLTYEQLSNRSFLAEGLAQFGFVQLPSEWWHFDFKNTDE